MVNYENGKIYKIVCTLPDIDDIYVGATTKKLSDRMSCHRCEAKGSKWNFKLYKFIRLHGLENFEIELLEEYSCNSKKELGKREQHWMNTLNPSLNSQNATSHRKEVVKRYNNKPETKALMRDYRMNNPDKYKYKPPTDAQKVKIAASYQRRMKAMTADEREAHLAKRKASYQRRRKAMTHEQLVAFRAKELARRKARKNKIELLKSSVLES